MADIIELNRRYLCREEATENKIYGSFEIAQRNMKLSLLSFDEFFFLKELPSIPVRLENNSYVTMFYNIYGGPGRSQTNRDLPRTAYTQTIQANIVVAGPEAWPTDRLIRHVQCRVPLADRLLRHTETYENLARTDPCRMPGTELLEVTLGEALIRISYVVSGLVGDPIKTSILPRIDIDFPDGRLLDDYLPTVNSIVRFFSAAICLKLRPHNLEIGPQTHAERMMAIQTHTPAHMFEVHYIWPSDSITDESSVELHGAFALSYTDAQRDNLKACLHAWLERDEEWCNATTLMMGSFKLKGEISAERMLAAFKWMEEIPTAKQLMPINNCHVKKIAAQAARVAAKLGYGEWLKRIEGSLSVLRFESHRDRFSRIAGTLRDRFGADIVDAKIVDHLVRATTFRGRIAHGHFEPCDDDEFAAFTKANAALECFNYLLMLRDLPISDEGIERIRSSRILVEYRFA